MNVERTPAADVSWRPSEGDYFALERDCNALYDRLAAEMRHSKAAWGSVVFLAVLTLVLAGVLVVSFVA